MSVNQQPDHADISSPGSKVAAVAPIDKYVRSTSCTRDSIGEAKGSSLHLTLFEKQIDVVECIEILAQRCPWQLSAVTRVRVASSLDHTRSANYTAEQNKARGKDERSTRQSTSDGVE
eukprot:56679-Eustigmatos_ZCMA.PRE.1